MDLAEALPLLLAAAWLLPLASFTFIVLFGPRLGKAGIGGGYVATAAILCSFVLSLIALVSWFAEHGTTVAGHHTASHDTASHAAAGDHAGAEHRESQQGSGSEHTVDADEHAAHADEHASHGHPDEHHAAAPQHYSGDWYSLGEFGRGGSLRITIGYYIDALTVAMFVMVTLIALCIHFYAIGYMHDELHEVTDHEVKLEDGHHLHRPGRFPRFFQYLSLFCFSMLGLVIAGNIAMVFVFWELVGICSYFLIGFYIERKSASNAANKAFIVNRIGDFGMIIGLMALWGSLGTFSFGNWTDGQGREQPGIFNLVRSPENGYRIRPPDGMVALASYDRIERIVRRSDDAQASRRISGAISRWRSASDWGSGYWLLIIAGLGIFCGCVGKSAQFPLHVWLPDAMEGPTPVSALVHSATMVAAGVYLVGRFFPVFVPEVLLAIAYIGGITLFIAATIAITATDIKRVLAYSTVSQLGYMMLALGIGGWLAGLFHLITHAFFKSLLFMCSGSVIHACHTNEMTKMGGLRKKMPWTAYTMLAGCLAIAGAPFTSGFYSKDYIVAQSLSFTELNPAHSILFYAVAVGAAITAFYMFRLWYMTFAGPPRDHHIYDHAHESPKVMYIPLVILAVFAIGIGWEEPVSGLSVENTLEQARPAGELGRGKVLPALEYPDEHQSHLPRFHSQATIIASGAALAGFLLATFFYGLRLASADEARRAFTPIYGFLRNKWYFDELYNVIFVRPVMFVSRLISEFDKRVIDRLIDGAAFSTRWISRVDDAIDRIFVDGLVNLTAGWLYSGAVALRGVQTGNIRQYVLLIVVGTVALVFVVRWGVVWAGG